LKIAHWTYLNSSGLANVASSISAAENLLGLTSIIADTDNPETWKAAKDADVFVLHTCLPNSVSVKGKIQIGVLHGTPEHIFGGSVTEGKYRGYGAGDGLALTFEWLQRMDAIVTFWPRHAVIWQQLAGKHAKIFTLPMGLDKGFWSPQPSQGKFAGEPSLFTAENCHSFKWSLDLMVAWPIVCEKFPNAKLHVAYLPQDVHRWFFPFAMANGTAYNAYLSPLIFDPSTLRNAFCSVDYYCSPVRYGDFNRICLEAKACGCKVISYEGNPYADYWISEGSQLKIAEQLKRIFRGTIKARSKVDPVPIIDSTVEALRKIYESV